MRNLLLIAGVCMLFASCEQSASTGALIKTKVYRHDGKQFNVASVKESAEYFILYYSASW